MILKMENRAFLLDDDEFDAELSLMAAKRSNPNLLLEWFSDYRELERKLDETTESSLVIIDLKMPGMQGDLLLERWSDRYESLDHNFVLFTSSDLSSDRDKCIRAGASAYYVKPMRLDEFRKEMASILSTWLPAN